jgi:hypothetical protein
MLFTTLILGAKFTSHSKKVILNSAEEAEVKVVQKLAGTYVRGTAGLTNGLRFLAPSRLTVTTVRFTVPVCLILLS